MMNRVEGAPQAEKEAEKQVAMIKMSMLMPMLMKMKMNMMIMITIITFICAGLCRQGPHRGVQYTEVLREPNREQPLLPDLRREAIAHRVGPGCCGARVLHGKGAAGQGCCGAGGGGNGAAGGNAELLVSRRRRQAGGGGSR